MDERKGRKELQAPYDSFTQLDIRVGRVVRCEPFPEARKPSYRLYIDFGELGEKQSSAQLTDLYTQDQLVGKLVVAVVNFAPRRIAGFSSEVLVLGVPASGTDPSGPVVVLQPEREVEPGAHIF